MCSSDLSLLFSAGKFYGMTYNGGADPHDQGTVFSVDTSGAGYTIMHNCDSTGYNPKGSLVLLGNTLFGMMEMGGTAPYSEGTIFSVHTDGSNFKVLLNFNVTNGLLPYGDLLISGNRLFGMTEEGGDSNSGCIFSIDTDGTNYTLLHSFSQDGNGEAPFASLIIAGSTLYGTTYFNYINRSEANKGVIFSIQTNGTAYTVLHKFNGSDGE